MDPLEKFRLTRDKWLVQGSPSPFNYIHKLLNYGIAAGKFGTGRSRFQWAAEEDVLYYDNQSLHMMEWKKFIHKLIDELEDMLSQELLFRRDGRLPDVNLHGFTDNAMRREAGYYFAHDTPQAWNQARRRVLSNLRESNEWDKLVEVGGDSIEFVQAGIDDYEHKDALFRLKLYIVMISTCGLAGRVQETTSLKIWNTMEGDRNIYVKDGQCHFVTEYHKSQAVTDFLRVYFTSILAENRLYHDSLERE